MTLLRGLAAVACVVVPLVTVAHAQVGPAAHDARATGQPAAALGARSYRNLFAPSGIRGPQPTRPSLQPPGPPDLQPSIKCGLTVIEVDGSIDPKMPALSKSTDTKYTIVAVEPSLCR